MVGSIATILIVDDEIRNCRLLEALLRPEGYVTETAASGAAALASIAVRAPDLILLDALMPDMSGYQLATILKAAPATAAIPIMIVTAQNDRASRLAGLDAGAEEFLSRPIDRAELWLRIRNLLRLKVLSDLLQNQSTILEAQVQSRNAELHRFRAAMDATADAIVLIDCATMMLVEVNATASTMFGYTREELLKMRGWEIGLLKPEDMLSLCDRTDVWTSRSGFREARPERKDGSRLDVEVHWHSQVSDLCSTLVVVVRDITERKEAEKRLHYLAHHDALTGLPNRTQFYDTLTKTLAQADSGGWHVAVMFIDLDHFKTVNDTLGHAIGDELLMQFGNRLTDCVRIRDTVGRLGGDEFALILAIKDGEKNAALIANKIREVLNVPFDLKGHATLMTASIGITIYPTDASDAESLIKYADTAMYQAKRAGRNTCRFYTAQMNVEVLARVELESALREAIEKNEFILYYQPKIDLKSGRIIGVEALVRWQRPGHGLVAPDTFIPSLEETGLIAKVGRQILTTACRQIATWRRMGFESLQVSVNISGRQFAAGDLDTVVIQAIEDNGIPARLLELELTESSLMANTEHAIASMRTLKSRGVQISIDDFGTGYSSLAYLCKFPVDKLKIDLSFVRNITKSPEDAAIVLAIIRMAHSLKLEVIAEGVETAAQLAYLHRYRCNQVQGYYFSPPVAALELERILHVDKMSPIFDGIRSPRRSSPKIVRPGRQVDDALSSRL